MQPPISAGTVLQNRYRILRVLGQGGFGRTYLAEDQGRFNEPCALKEFIPIQSSAYAIDKSKELFQREAAILYQIQHPQIPQFRATFEENQRLFLVQDYVEGKTYRELLNDRQTLRSTFSEAEILQLLQQLLPVLAHIHSKGIIHRDIAPDNMILRQRDQLPVLIDFGVVKDIATRVQSLETVPQHTSVGKLGYAPTEQMQSGRAYPSSDLYALAVTCLVLLTGREPSELYDDRSLTWQWRHLATASPGFAQILDRMLSYQPGDRYQSVSEVAQAIQALINPAATPPLAPPALVPPAVPAAPTPPTPISSGTSQMPTVAVGRRPNPVPSPTVTPVRRLDPIIPTPAPSVWDNPWAVVAIGTGLALVTGIGSWAVVSAIRNTNQTPSVVVTPTPTPSVTPTPTPTPTSTPTPQPVEYSQRLNLDPGNKTTAQGTLKANETVTYRVTAEQGQKLNARLRGEGVLLTVLAPDQKPADDGAERVQQWQGTLDFTGDYAIQLRPVAGLSQSDYNLDVSLDPADAPEPSPTPSPTPPIDPVTLNVPVGETGIQVPGSANAQVIRRYRVDLQEGQVLSTEIVSGAIKLTVRDPNGTPLADAEGIVSWSSQAPQSGTYSIDVIAVDRTDFTISVKVTDAPPAAQ